MSAVLIGFALGIIAYFFAKWISKELGPLYSVVTDPLSHPWLRIGMIALVVTTSTVWIAVIFVIVHVWPPLAITFDLHRRWEFGWTLFYATWFGRGCVGFALGLATAAWGMHATKENASNVGLLGAVLGVMGAIVTMAVFDHDLKFLGRLSKVSTSVVSFELQAAQTNNNRGKSESSETTAKAWTAFEPANTALILLDDLAQNAIRRDEAIATFATDSAAPLRDENEDILKQTKLFQDVLHPFVDLRRAIHLAKRDASVGLFYSEEQELIGLAIALRDLVLFDVWTSEIKEAERQTKIDTSIKAIAAVVRRTREEACEFELWKQNSLTPNQAASIEEAASCGDRGRHLTNLESMMPGRMAVRKTPYFAILSAMILFGSGEREAAAALLDHWRHQAPDQPAKPLPQRSTYRDKIVAVYDVRVVNLIGIILSDPQNVVLIELATHYQWSAMNLSDEIIKGNSRLKAFMEGTKAAKNEPGLIAVASELSAGRRVNCPAIMGIPQDVAYFVYRRTSQLNNAIFYLTQQSNILELEGVSSKLDEWMNALEATRRDCLALAIGLPYDDIAADLASFADTLVHGYLAKAALQKSDTDQSRRSLCRAYRAAYVADKLAGAPRHVDLTDHRQFLARSLFQNGTNISNFKFKNSARESLRTIRDQIEAAGEGACAKILTGKLEPWGDDD